MSETSRSFWELQAGLDKWSLSEWVFLDGFCWSFAGLQATGSFTVNDYPYPVVVCVASWSDEARFNQTYYSRLLSHWTFSAIHLLLNWEFFDSFSIEKVPHLWNAPRISSKAKSRVFFRSLRFPIPKKDTHHPGGDWHPEGGFVAAGDPQWWLLPWWAGGEEIFRQV